MPIWFLASLLLASEAQSPRLLTASDLTRFDSPAPDRTIFYGDDPLQFGELRLPEGAGPHPVVILVHGGCWLSEYDIAHIRKLAAAMTRSGVATWTLEYRRVGNPGGGWPGTFEDIARGADHLRVLAREFPLDLSRVLAAGHSAGGHLALWLGARKGELFGENPVRPRAILGLAPAPDLAHLYERGVCGNVVDSLLGGSPTTRPERYRMASVTELVPLGIPQVLVLGRFDESWTPVGRRYYEAAREASDDVRVIEAPESGHFEMIDPDSTTWRLVEGAMIELLGLRAR